MYLYLNTTNNLNIGIVDFDLNFVVYKSFQSKKISQILQAEIYVCLQEAKTSMDKLEGIFYCAGPGSYTGMRVAQGFVDICQWKRIQVFSFHAFQVPYLLGINSGHWISEAFKGEYFVYEWNGEQSKSHLIKQEDLQGQKFESTIYSNEKLELNENISLVSRMIEENPSKFFKRVQDKKMKESLYYYRPLEEEFKVPNG